MMNILDIMNTSGNRCNHGLINVKRCPSNNGDTPTTWHIGDAKLWDCHCGKRHQCRGH